MEAPPTRPGGRQSDLRLILRSALPWAISGLLLLYVFGYTTDWRQLLAATERANLPLFLLYATADRLAFFLIWTWLSATALRRFVAHVPVASVFAIRGGSELARVVSNHLGDAAFLLGVARLAGGRIDAVLAATLLPVIGHFFVMLVQMTLALPFLPGRIRDHPDVVGVIGVLWSVVGLAAVGIWLTRSKRFSFRALEPVAAWLERFPLRELGPFVGGFAVLAVFDVQIQWFASDAFGVPIPWSSLAARIPLVYLSFLIPTLGNFGTRELAWATAFSDYGSRDALVAYALAINAVFLVLNALLGLIFLRPALDLIGAVRRARRQGEPLPRPILHDPTDQ